MNIISRKNLYFLLSGLVIVPGLIFLILFGLNFGIDFTGGSQMEFQITNPKNSLTRSVVKNVIQANHVNVATVTQNAPGDFSIRTEPIDQKKNTEILTLLNTQLGTVKEKSFDTVGPTIGAETEKNALMAVLIASLAITVYIAFAFREVSHPIASWKFGVCAVLALLHDILVVVGIFAILGKLLG